MSRDALSGEEVAAYLDDNPQFFEQYAELFSRIYVPHPHGGRAIPLSERQVLTLRERSRALESRLADLLKIGEENDAIGEKMHRLCVALLGASDARAIVSVLYYHLREDFAVPHAALRLWRGAGDPDQAEFGAAGDELKHYAGALLQPYCGPSGGAEPAAEAVGWFGEAASHVRSVALMPLADGGRCFGLLALGSEDAMRFYPEMGTLYLGRLGEMASAALLRVV